MIETITMLVFAVIGCGAVVFGVSQWSGPGGWVAFGIFCILIALWPLLRTQWFERF